MITRKWNCCYRDDAPVWLESLILSTLFMNTPLKAQQKRRKIHYSREKFFNNFFFVHSQSHCWQQTVHVKYLYSLYSSIHNSQCASFLNSFPVCMCVCSNAEHRRGKQSERSHHNVKNVERSLSYNFSHRENKNIFFCFLFPKLKFDILLIFLSSRILVFSNHDFVGEKLLKYDLYSIHKSLR